MTNKSFQLFTFVTALCVSSTAAFAATSVRYVNNNSRTGNCPGSYSTIQAAVDASNSGDKVVVCNGVYPEQVMISKNLTLEGQSGATIQPTTATVNANDGFPAAAIVYVNGLQNTVSVTVEGLIVDGSLAFQGVNNCGEDVLGIYYTGASGTIVDNAVRFIEQSSGYMGCQVGLAILADNPNSATNSVTIERNSVHDFQKNGITVTGIGLTAAITGNTILGLGPTLAIAQNGIQFGPDGSGTVTGNNASGFVYAPCVSPTNCNYASTGVLIYDTDAGVTVSGNILGQSQGAVYNYYDGGYGSASATCSISKNQVTDTLVYDGIAFNNSGNTVSNNTVINSAESGIALYGGPGNKVSGNTIIEAPVGVLIEATNYSSPANNIYVDVVQLVETSMPTPGAASHRFNLFHSK